VARAAVIGQVNAIVQSRIQQQLAPLRQNACPIDRNSVVSFHCPIRRRIFVLIYG
jgi:hypothetical protein